MHKPDARGYFGEFGGKFVPEVLYQAITELEAAMNEAFADPAFWEEYHAILRDYVGRPSPIYVAERFAPGRGTVVFKREDLNHTGAHKINNTVGQALLAKRMGKKRLDRGDRRRTARRGNGDDRGQDGLPGRRLHGRARRRASGAQRLRHEVARRKRSSGLEWDQDAQGCNQRGVSRVGGARVEDACYAAIGSVVGAHPCTRIWSRRISEGRSGTRGAQRQSARTVLRPACRRTFSPSRWRKREQRHGDFAGFSVDDPGEVQLWGARRPRVAERIRRRDRRHARWRPGAVGVLHGSSLLRVPANAARDKCRIPTRSAPASTIPASVPSTPTCAIAAAPSTFP